MYDKVQNHIPKFEGKSFNCSQKRSERWLHLTEERALQDKIFVQKAVDWDRDLPQAGKSVSKQMEESDCVFLSAGS